MSRLWPETLVGRTLMVLLLGFVVSHLVSLAIYWGDRTFIQDTARGGQVAEIMNDALETLERLPTEQRVEATRAYSGYGVRLAWLPQSILPADTGGFWRLRSLRSEIAERLGGIDGERLRVDIRAPEPGDDDAFPRRRMWRHHHEPRPDFAPRPPPGLRRPAELRRPVLLVSVRLTDGSWLNARAWMPGPRPFWESGFFLSMILATVVVVGVSIWAVRRASRPLGALAAQAARLGADVDAPPMPEEGPREVRRAAHAFNQMQERLGTFVRDRTQLLAAISHDLRTPITRMRLRAELVEDEEQRAKMLADLAQMEQMIAATLAFARDDAAAEARRPFDLAVMLADLCADAAETGAEADYRGPARLSFTGRPTALRRVFQNLVDNALAYGGNARVTLAATGESVVVEVADDGPGMPPESLERAFAPFYRVEASRNPETGGVGLGLAVVRSVVRGHGGEVTLANRPEGGLMARVELPVSA